MSWIKTINFEDADPKLKRIYNRIAGPNNTLDNVLTIHSLRPHTLVGHMGLYKSVLHNSNNSLPKWYLEALGVYVSTLNKCNYCVQHHSIGFKKAIQDQQKANDFLKAVENDSLEQYFDLKYLSGMRYAKKLTLELNTINQEDIKTLKEVGITDGQILEINQVVSYFNYVNRSVLGLGVNLKGDILGLSPSDSDDPKNWSHQ
ncbi:MAG: peroxidase-related enzyme [Flavobacteriaceae bacterium]|nr:peroxidase-related enzyme [Flavobacteriaceae bacterium]